MFVLTSDENINTDRPKLDYCVVASTSNIFKDALGRLI